MTIRCQDRGGDEGVDNQFPYLEGGLGTQVPRYSEVQCILSDGHMGTPYGQTDACENITLTQFSLRAVNTAL